MCREDLIIEGERILQLIHQVQTDLNLDFRRLDFSCTASSPNPDLMFANYESRFLRCVVIEFESSLRTFFYYLI